MQSFNSLLAEYLKAYGDDIRENGQDIEFRGIQRHLYRLAQIIETEDMIGLIELKEEHDELLTLGY